MSSDSEDNLAPADDDDKKDANLLSPDPTSGANTSRKVNNSISSTSKSTNSENSVEYELSKEFLKKQDAIQKSRLRLA